VRVLKILGASAAVRRIFALAFATLTVLAAVAPAASAQDSLQIVAIVNDDAITKIDLIVRMQLVMHATGLQDSPEVRARLAPQVLRALIDERLKRAEAKRAGVTATRVEVERALAQLAQRNGMSIDQFNKAVEQDPLVAQAFSDEAAAAIAWEKLVRTKLGPTINVTQQDVDDEMRRINENIGKPEYQLAEIFLAVDQPDQDVAVRQSGERLMDQLRQGADFGRLARQFSQSTNATNGGLVGWVRPDQLDEELANAMTGMHPGQVTGPVKSTGGYYIMMLREVRQSGKSTPDDAVVSLKQIFVSAPASLPKAERDDAMKKIMAIRAQISNCTDMDAVGRQYMPPNTVDLGSAAVSDLPNEIKEIGRSLPVGQISDPVTVDTGIGIFMVCGRKLATDAAPTRDQVAKMLVANRLDQLARGYLRDLRRAAVIDIRNASL
jgi:peptidyl-prolyl cis-trans isomerase SurA